MDQLTDGLLERIERLEAQHARLKSANHRLYGVTAGLLLALGALTVMGQATPAKSIEAEQFVLRSSDGQVRGTMGVGDGGAVGINLNDSKGQPRIEMDVAANGSPGVDLYDPEGKLRATLALGPNGTPGLGLYDSSGKLRTSLDVPAAKTPGLAFYHPDGKPSWGAP
jgi:hypothetical protein